VTDGNRPDVVEAVRVIGVVVCEEHGVDVGDPGGDQLQPQLRRRINEQPRPLVLDHGADPRALVARIGGTAHRAAAADLRNAETRAGAEEGQLHTISTLS
jgi:hypothetical protein